MVNMRVKGKERPTMHCSTIDGDDDFLFHFGRHSKGWRRDGRVCGLNGGRNLSKEPLRQCNSTFFCYRVAPITLNISPLVGTDDFALAQRHRRLSSLKGGTAYSGPRSLIYLNLGPQEWTELGSILPHIIAANYLDLFNPLFTMDFETRWTGNEKTLVIAIDVGTTQSNTSL
jgi:hypothetical protein